MAISVAQARKICTQSELDLVLMSTTSQIGSLDAKQLKSSIVKTRNLRDKWRDLSKRQIRTTKRMSPEDLEAANQRSVTKAELFSEALGRFSKRLLKVDPSSANFIEGLEKPTKQRRTASHRSTRADVKTVLSRATDQINKASTKKKPATRSGQAANATSAPSAPAKTATKSSVKKVASKKAARPKVSKKKVAAVRTAKKRTVKKASAPTVSPVELQKPAFGTKPVTATSKRDNLKAVGAAKASIAPRSGATKIRSHVSAQNRRNQAKRNVRKRT